MRIFTLLLTIVLILCGVSFAALNAKAVTINFYFKLVTMPVSLVIVLSFGLGMLVGFCLIVFKTMKLKRENRKMKGKIELTQKEVKNLRAIPLKDEH
jgi:lipopolysaccharide assembly protein A